MNYWPDNFVNKKIWNLIEYTDFNKRFHIQSKGHSLSQTAFEK